MDNYDINGPTPFVANDDQGGGGATLPPSSIGGMGPLAALSYLGQHGNTAMPMAQQMGQGGLGAMGMRTPVFAGGLATPGGQAALEQSLFSRVRDPSQMQDSKDARKAAFDQLQSATLKPMYDMSPFDTMMMGMASNDKPWDAGNGVRAGIANTLQMKMMAQKQAHDAAIQAAQQGGQFEANEENIADKNEKDALDDLEKISRPVRGGLMGGPGGGMQPKNVPGVGLVGITYDENGQPQAKVLMPEGKTLAEARQKAMGIVNKMLESNNNQMSFPDDASRQQWIEQEVNRLTNTFLPNNQSVTAGPAAPAGSGKGMTLPTKGTIPDDILDGLRSTEAGKTDGFVVNPKTKALGPYQFTPETAALLNRAGLKFNPFDEDQARNAANIYLTKLVQDNGGDMKKALAQYGGFVTKDPTAYQQSVLGNAAATGAAPAGTVINPKLSGPDVQKAQIATAEQIAKSKGKQYEQALEDSNNGQKTIQTLTDLKQLPFNPGAFAQWQKQGGSLMAALGDNGPLAKQAANSAAAEGLLQNLTNARMLLEHGTQTADDEVRFKKEIANISNPKQAYDYMIKHMQELAVKAQDRYNTMDSVVTANGGNSYNGANEAWQAKQQNYGPLVRRYQGGYIGRSEFINNVVNDPANQKAYGGDKDKLQQRAQQEWLKMGG